MKIFCITDNDYSYLEKCYVRYPEAPIISVFQDISDRADILDNEIVGFLFSSKCFLKYDIPLSEAYINEKFEKYDVIMPYYATLKSPNSYRHYEKLTKTTQHLDFVKEYIKNNCPEYLTACEYIYDAKIFSSADTVILRKKMLRKYLEFFVPCLEALHEEYDDVRDMLIHDWTFRIFLAANKIAVKEERAAKVNYDIFTNEAEKIKLKQKYIDMRLEPLISFRKNLGFETSLADIHEPEDDFEGKIPIFVCWFQGEQNMPQLIKACIESIKRHIPHDMTCFRLITMENVMQYVTFTEDVIKKFNDGIISYTHLSDLLRTELLYRYGGMWIDATYYISRDIPAEIFEDELFTIAFDKILWGQDVIKSRWSSSFLYAKNKNNQVIQFLLEGLWQYWESENELIDYFVFDYIWDAGYRGFEKIKEQVDAVRKSPYAVYDLQMRMNQRYTLEENERIESDSFCYKLNRRNEYHYYNDFNHKTVYGNILEEAQITEDAVSKDVAYEINDIASLINYMRQENLKEFGDKKMLLAEYGAISKLTIPDILGDDTKIKGNKLKDYPSILDSIYEWS